MQTKEMELGAQKIMNWRWQPPVKINVYRLSPVFEMT